MSSLKKEPTTSRAAEPNAAAEPIGAWRSLEELEGKPAFQNFLAKEFPANGEELRDPLSRRRFMQLMGASLAFAGVAGPGCRWEEEHIVPLSRRPEGVVPGVPRYYATSWEFAGSAEGLVVEVFDGRPIKVEGNALHPYTGRATSHFAQASILELYDPDRSRHVVRRDGARRIAATWDDFVNWARTAREPGKKGSLRILAEPTSSPAIAALRAKLLETVPGAKWHEYAALSSDNAREGTKLAFGAPHRVRLRLDRAAVIATFDAELFANHPAAVPYARDFAAGRDPETGQMNRLYSVESVFSLTGGMAEHRLPIRAELIKPILLGLEQRVLGGDLASVGAAVLAEEPVATFIEALARDLAANPGRGVVAVGDRQPPEVHAIAARLNERLKNAGKTVVYSEDSVARPHHVEDLKSLLDDIAQGKVESLFILGGNPAYDAPADFAMADALAKVPQSVHLSDYDNETSALCAWHINRAHYLESWDAGRSWDGTLTLRQPLIRPLFAGKSALEVLKILSGQESVSDETLVRDQLNAVASRLIDSESAWQKALHDGFVAGTDYPTASPTLVPFQVSAFTPSQKVGTRIGNGSLEAVFTASSQTYDGRFANNGWLVETPDFLTKLTWDNAALLSPRTAADLGISNRELVEVEVGGRSQKLVAYVLPGHAPYSIGLPLGWGRSRAGHVAGHSEWKVNPIGFDVYPLRSSDGMGFVGGVTIKGTGAFYDLAETQDHFALEPRAQETLARRAEAQIQNTTLEHYRREPNFVLASAHIEADKKLIPPAESYTADQSLFDEHEYQGHRWGMTTDLSRCTGCNSCMVACQAENNVPIVGKEQVMKNREMHWIRIDRFFHGNPENPRVAGQPIFCQQCEMAPCEQVCPVGATVHSLEGLNDMAYNRCVGTRYCANNCPYKVRRFNFHNWNEELDEARSKVKKLVFNPDVTVRSRGVMEKCTWCVQRIEGVKIEAKNARRPIEDGEIQTACQEACPTGAITFGDLSDTSSAVVRLQKLPRAYALLSGLNTVPRHSFLARIRNPNEALEPTSGEQTHHE